MTKPTCRVRRRVALILLPLLGLLLGGIGRAAASSLSNRHRALPTGLYLKTGENVERGSIVAFPRFPKRHKPISARSDVGSIRIFCF